MLKAIKEKILLKEIEENKIQNGIIIPDNVKNSHVKAKVISIGNEVNIVKENDIVLVAKNSYKFKHEDVEIMCVHEADIICILGSEE